MSPGFAFARRLHAHEKNIDHKKDLIEEFLAGAEIDKTYEESFRGDPKGVR